MQVDIDNTIDDGDEYQVSDNFVEDLVAFSRANQIGNEQQAVVALLIYGTGLLPDWHDYIGGLITGGSSGGKSHMKREVVDAAFDYCNDWLYQTSGGSDKAAIDDDMLDEARIGAFDEYQKIPDEMREFLKSITEDGGFTYARNVADSDRESGRKTVKIERDPLPIVFQIADENETVIDQEMTTRLVEVKVEESESKNKGVHYMHHGHEGIQMDDMAGTYISDRPELEHAVKAHIRDVPLDTAVVLPTGTDRFDGDGWDEADVTAPLLSFKRSESTRASAALASLVKSSALYNYHNRDIVTVDGEDHIVAETQDVANVISCRETLLATTHGLTSKKFAIIDAIMERGSPVPSADSDTALQADKDTVIEHIQQSTDIATMSKTEIGNLLDELDEDLIINKQDHPDDARKNIYVYDGAAAFERPNIEGYASHFADATDPIRDQHISTTVDEQLEQLNAKLTTDVGSLSAAEAMGPASDDAEGLSAFGEGGTSSELSEAAQRVRERLTDTIGESARVGSEADIAHLLGVVPLEDEDGVLLPTRDVRGDDRVDTVLAPDEWDGAEDFDGVESAIASAITELKDADVLEMDDNGEYVDVSITQ